MHSWVPELLVGRYEVTGEIGRGGCALVVEARDLHLHRLVAIKVLKDRNIDVSARERFAREARVAAQIHHPNVCSIIDVGRLQDGRPFLVMERLWGETLRACLQRVGPLDAEVAIDFAMQMLSGLEAVHSVGVVHRDMKPDNVFLVQRNGCMPIVKLLDFGMCRGKSLDLTAPLDDRTLTRAGTVVGTPEYMAPEQAAGKRAFDGRIDVYAVGLLLYESLSGARVFEGSDARGILISILTKRIPPLRSYRPDLPPALDRVIARALERDPGARYATVRHFQEALSAAKDSLDRRSGEVHRETTEWDMPTRRFVRAS
jgi:serine/threonine-protein kinase